MATPEKPVTLRSVFNFIDTERKGYITQDDILRCKDVEKRRKCDQNHVLQQLDLDKKTMLNFNQFRKRIEEKNIELMNSENIGPADNQTPPFKITRTPYNNKQNIGSADKRTPLQKAKENNLHVLEYTGSPAAGNPTPLKDKHDDDVFVGQGEGHLSEPRDTVLTPTRVAKQSLLTRKSSGFSESDQALESHEIRQELGGIHQKVDNILVDLTNLQKAVENRNSLEINEKLSQLELDKHDRDTKLASERIRHQRLLEKRKVDEAEIEYLKNENSALKRLNEDLRYKLDSQARRPPNPDNKDRRKLASMIAKCQSHKRQLKLELGKIDLEFKGGTIKKKKKCWNVASSQALAGNEHKNLLESSPDESPRAASSSSSSADSIKEQKSR